MPKIRKTEGNPFGLTYKQNLVLKDVVGKLEKGKKLDLAASHRKFYKAKNTNSLNSTVHYNMYNSKNFREALIISLTEKKILGADSKTEDVLIAGLDAKDKDGNVSYDTRLKYAQEINKIAGVYAPERKANLNLNVDMTEEDLDKHIKDLQEELS